MSGVTLNSGALNWTPDYNFGTLSPMGATEGLKKILNGKAYIFLNGMWVPDFSGLERYDYNESIKYLEDHPEVKSTVDPGDLSLLFPTREVNERLKSAINDPIKYTIDKSKSEFQLPSNPTKDPNFVGSTLSYLKDLRLTLKQQLKSARSKFWGENYGSRKKAWQLPELKALHEQKRADRQMFKTEQTRLKSLGYDTGIYDGEKWAKGASLGLGDLLYYGSRLALNTTLAGKNFTNVNTGAGSIIHGLSGALASTGNPYLIAAAGLGEAGYYATNAFGKTNPGYTVDIASDSYGQNLLHLDPTSFNIFESGIQRNQFARNQMNMRLATQAKNIADIQHLNTEATNKAAEDVAQFNNAKLNNRLYDTRLISARNGGLLKRIIDFKQAQLNKELSENNIIKAQNGAKLEKIEVSDEHSVIPEGSLHKNKHEDFDLDVTPKGIPVVTVKDDNVETLLEIQEQKDTLVQHAEIEHNEVIFSKELTDFIEDERKKWHEADEKDNDICLKVGLRLTKELLTNTDDNTGLVEKIESQIL